MESQVLERVSGENVVNSCRMDALASEERQCEESSGGGAMCGSDVEEFEDMDCK